jgi:hypothetical protein
MIQAPDGLHYQFFIAQLIMYCSKLGCLSVSVKFTQVYHSGARPGAKLKSEVPIGVLVLPANITLLG